MTEPKKPEVLRFDFVFSYWIFIWWILYELGLVKQNPKFIIMIAILYIFYLISINNNTASSCYLLPFIISCCIIKFYPLFSLRNTTIQYSDVIFSFLFFLVYLCWVLLNGGIDDVLNFYLLSGEKKRPPFEYYFNKFFKITC